MENWKNKKIGKVGGNEQSHRFDKRLCSRSGGASKMNEVFLMNLLSLNFGMLSGMVFIKLIEKLKNA